MALTTESRKGQIPLRTAVRRDTWWVKPVCTALGLAFFLVWVTFRAFENDYYLVGSYLTPFYSPLIEPHWKIGSWAISPAFYILIFPAAFRGTCYYYRQAYYRSFFLDPPACAVPEPGARKHYHGEREFPLIFQNLHRYALYAALVFLVFLWKDAIEAWIWDGRLSMRLGTLIMLVNMVLLTGYTFGCHSLRHLVGGRFDCFSCPMNPASNGKAEAELRPGYRAWRFVSNLNKNHMQWAWTSLASIILTDMYIRAVAAGAISDIRFF